MKLFKQSYYLLIFSAISLATVFFMKINKHIFYSHYFKVIEEVELRNSQEVKTALEWGALNTSFSIASVKTIIQHLFARYTSSHILESKTVDFGYEAIAALISVPHIYLSTQPVRAP